ncbi:MNNG and nitrosoguanidine resistance protein [Penicillium brevicompactum]|uniref:MNNG and nitrosoguanidine resistance protein n=1 Tax=Penicillium brevicompactum TaxID=5074 RepID=UPI00254116F1|nr:MNNG and nitrosoguanidine resistance protein [Penicillium brevicompactum]KAJ5326286.1 MNNG and nitrosoguanidine resistance protein [Penicillium brevicompactum]
MSELKLSECPVFLLCVFVLAILSLFWAVQFSVEKKMSALTVWVVDFDGQVDPYRLADPLVGPIVANTTLDIIESRDVGLGYQIKSPADFQNDPVAVRQAVYDEHAYAAIIINSNATALLNAALSQGNTSYDPSGAVLVVTLSARDPTTYSNYIMPAIHQFERAVLSNFGSTWVKAAANNSFATLSRVPQALNPGIGFTTLDLRPFGPAVATPAITIGLIYLIIIAFFTFPFLMPIHLQYFGGNLSTLKMSHWIMWRVLSNIGAYFFLSFFYSLVSLAFQIPLSNPSVPGIFPARNANGYGSSSFVVYWALNWVGMSALGFPCENMAMVLGFPWSSLFLIFWVITNVATGFYSLDLAPGFFRWGYAWPLHRIVEASRTILFDTHSRIGLDFGVLFVWIAVSLAFFPIANRIMHWRIIKFGK